MAPLVHRLSITLHITLAPVIKETLQVACPCSIMCKRLRALLHTGGAVLHSPPDCCPVQNLSCNKPMDSLIAQHSEERQLTVIIL